MARLWDSGAPPSLLRLVAVVYAVLMAVSLPQLIDPLVRHDDFPALLVDPSGFYAKTLHEGRWLNYWWHLRGVMTPAWANFAAYQLCWAVFCAAAARAALGRAATVWPVLGLALLIAVAPPALLISLWFNTLIPGLALVALFAVLANRLPPRAMRWLLVLFVPLTLMAYTTYPLLLLAVCLTTHGAQTSWRDVAGPLAIFIASFALGILAIYGLNYLEHGIFGIPMADWRTPQPTRDLASLMANLDRIGVVARKTALAFAWGFTPLSVAHGLLAAGGLIVLWRAERWAAVAALTVVIAGTGLLCLQILSTGVTVPVRAFGFVWMIHVVVMMRAALLLSRRGGLAARLARNLVIFIVASYLLQSARQYTDGWDWQAQTRALAQAAGPSGGAIILRGDYRTLAGATRAGIQNARGLRLRLVYLTGREVVLCAETPQPCTGHPATPPASARPVQAGEALIAQHDGGSLVWLPSTVPSR